MQTLVSPELLAFGPFVLDLTARALLVGEERLPLSSRAFDILVLLVTERDRVVGKDEIIAKVWRGVAVEENNLAVQISSLRRVLSQHADGPAMITTIPGQGYRFVARVSEGPAELREFAPPPPPTPVVLPAASGVATSRRRNWRLLAGCALLCLVALAAGLRFWPGPVEAPRLSIAVLPFRNLGEDAKQDSLADAISDDLTTDLSHLPGSTVIARESSDAYKGHAVPAEQIGRALKVRYLLEGSLRGVEGVFRINAQLIDATNGAHLWADRFDVPRDTLANAQSAIVGHIASVLKVKLVALESERSLRERPNTPDAWDLYFRARAIRDRAETLAEFSEAQKLLQHALILQPNFVEALTDLSLVLLAKVTDFEDPEDGVDLKYAKQLISQALMLAPKDPNALTAQGWLLSTDGRVSEAEASYRAAVAVDPNNVLARTGLADNDWLLGRPQATIEGLEYVLQLDPQGPAVKTRMAALGEAYFMIGRWQDAIDWLLRSLAGDPKDSSIGEDRFEFSRLFLMAAYDRLGDTARARNLYADYNRIWRNRSIWRLLSDYFSKAQAAMPGFNALASALAAEGMPLFARYVPAQHLEAVSAATKKGDYEAAPGDIPGTTNVDPAMLPALLKGEPRPLVVDVGRGAATLGDALWVPNPEAAEGGLDDTLKRAATHATPILIVGDGIYGWDGYDAVQRALKLGYQHIMWLRGGEESLAAVGYPTVDRRVP